MVPDEHAEHSAGAGDKSSPHVLPRTRSFDELPVLPRSRSFDAFPFTSAPMPASKKRSRVVLQMLMDKELNQHVDWKRRVFGIGPKMISLPASRMVHPSSPFAQGVVLVSSLLLMYTAIVTPFLIAFFWHWDTCNMLATLPFDMFIDSFFLAEIVFAFFVGTTVNGQYVDDWKQVAWTYASGMLFFDLFTSIPVSYLEFLNAQACRESGGQGGDNRLRFVRLLKPLRLFKLMRSFKALQLVEVLDDLEQWLRLPPFMFRMVRVFGIVMYVVHVFTCGYWLIKVVSNEPEKMADWYSQYVIDMGSQDDSDSAWSTDGVVGGRAVFHQYVLSMYYINTVFSTVGFGDIQAQNSVERIFSMVAMYAGTVVFGTLLSEVENSVAQLRRYCMYVLLMCC